MKHSMLVVAVISIAIVLRFHNYENRITFGSEQARSLTVAADYIKEKPSLLGQEYFRTTRSGLKLFSGAQFSYSLVPLLLAFRYDPFPITIYFTLLNIFTGIILYVLFKEIAGSKIALVAMTLFLFNDVMIAHSLFIWIMNYSPLVGLLIIYCLFKHIKSRKIVWVFITGVLTGIGFSLQYLFIIAAIPIVVFMYYHQKKRFLTHFYYVGGCLLGNLPMILFDLRHNFYHFNTLTEYAKETIVGQGSGNLAMYQFLHFWPLFALAGGWIIMRIAKMNKMFPLVFICVYLALNVYSPRISFVKSVGMPDGLVYQDIIDAAEEIAKNEPSNFNVVSLLDFDTRGYILRYPLKYLYQVYPADIVSYKEVDNVYALARADYNFSDNVPWELDEFRTTSVNSLGSIGKNYTVFILKHE